MRIKIDSCLSETSPASKLKSYKKERGAGCGGGGGFPRGTGRCI